MDVLHQLQGTCRLLRTRQLLIPYLQWAGYMPINSNETFDRFGKEYNISNVSRIFEDDSK